MAKEWHRFGALARLAKLFNYAYTRRRFPFNQEDARLKLYKVSKVLEVFSWVAGLVLLGFSVSHWAIAETSRRADLAGFELALLEERPDQSLWSDERIEAWEQGRVSAPEDVVAILSMPGLQLEVPVYEGSDDLTLDLGAGLIPGTAAPGESGNVGIAGHRDGFFRVLKDVQLGETLQLATTSGEHRYRVTETFIVDPYDVEVLESTDTPTVTLITCHPFYFIGSAPQRFIVRAELDETTVNHIGDN
jgi:LPXTG-site transpeptidase (sortase) family protein